MKVFALKARRDLSSLCARSLFIICWSREGKKIPF